MSKMAYIQILLTVMIASPVIGQNDTIVTPYEVADTLQEDLRLFTIEEPLELTLRFDITHYTRKKSTEDYLDAILTIHINDKDSINKDIKLKSRGEFRNQYCEFPPISLNFKKSSFKNTEFDKIEKMKMVTHCKSGNEQYLFKEYLIYKLYNILTDNSFRVRLVRITYINTYKESKPIRSYGFLIEPLSLLAERTNSTPFGAVVLTQKNIVPEMMDRMAIFNYMIGNSDWAVPNQHNCKILTMHNPVRPDLGMIVPYDFDYSGLVNAPYAVPGEDLGIHSVRERVYLGICRSEEVFRSALQEFSDKKEEFYRLIQEFPILKERSKKEMISYLDGFYGGFEKRNNTVYILMHKCRFL